MKRRLFDLRPSFKFEVPLTLNPAATGESIMSDPEIRALVIKLLQQSGGIAELKNFIPNLIVEMSKRGKYDETARDRVLLYMHEKNEIRYEGASIRLM